jgi:hypothetical protein
MRLISFALAGGASAASEMPIIDAGDTLTFPAGGNGAQPLVLGAELSPLALGYQVTDMLLRLLPGSDVFAKAGPYGKVLKAIVTAESKLWSGAKILQKLQQKPPNVTGANEDVYSLLTDHSFMAVFIDAAIIAGKDNGWPILTQLTPARLNQVELAANLAALDATLIAWDLQYFMSGYGEVKVTWPAAPASPTGVKATTSSTDGYTFKTLVTWTYPPGPAVSGFNVYVAMIKVFECVGTCAAPPPCPKPPFKTSTPSAGVWTLAKSVGPTVRKLTFQDPNGPALECGVWVQAVNSAGKSGLMKATWKSGG